MDWTVEPIDHRDPDVAAVLMTVQRAAYQVEADLIGYQGIPGLVEGPADIAALDLTVLAIHENGHGPGDPGSGDGSGGGSEGGGHDQRRVLGLVGYQRGGGVVEIDRLAVDPKAFRRGVGRALVGAVHTREPGARRFDVSTGAANAPAVALYTSMGYRRVATQVVDGCRVTRFARVL